MGTKYPIFENDRLGGTVVFQNNKKRCTVLHPQYHSIGPTPPHFHEHDGLGETVVFR